MHLVITIGDCNGVGLEVMFKAIRRFDRVYRNAADCALTISGNPETIKLYSDYLNYSLKFDSTGFYIGERHCNILKCRTYSHVEFGKLTQSAGKLSAEAIDLALEAILNKKADALVTMPISKEAIQLSGWKYPGHTEMLAAKCSVKKPIMILASGNVRVALMTIHHPIRKIAELIKTSELTEVIRLFNSCLIKDFGIRKPKIAILGLNPHAGEGGKIGTEELDIIIPAIEKCRMEHIEASGPQPADGFFAHGDYRFFDGILAMYHDQGLIPLKLIAGGSGVNYTGGLPIVRTSPDHGTAYAIAGRDIADESSAFEAIKLAIEIVNARS